MLLNMTDNELLRVLAHKLWVAYDAGGISCGRSARSIFLEGVIDLLGMRQIETSATDSELFAESVRRKRPLQYIIFREIDFSLMPESLLLSYLIASLADVSKRDEFKCSFWEARIIEAMSELVPLAPGEYNVSVQEIQGYFLGRGHEREYTELEYRLRG